MSAHRVGDDMRGYWEHTENLRCIGGNQQLATELARRVPRLLLSAPVEAIELSPGKVRVGFRHEQRLHVPGLRLRRPRDAADGLAGRPAPTRPSGPRTTRSRTARRSSTSAPSTASSGSGPSWPPLPVGPARQRLGEHRRPGPPDRRGPFGLSVYSGGPFVRRPEGLPQADRDPFPGYGAKSATASSSTGRRCRGAGPATPCPPAARS